MKLTIGSKLNARVNASEAASISIISIILSAAISIGSSNFRASVLIVTSSGLFFSWALGRVALSQIVQVIPISARFSAELTFGVAIISILMLMLCIIFKCSADVAFVVACGIGFVAMVMRTGSPIADYASCGSTCVICGLAFIWSMVAIWAVPAMQRDFILPAWQDFFYHSAMIAQFAHFSDFGGSWIFARGTDLPVYHYAPYLLPSAIAALSGTPTLVLATAFIPPFSFIIMGLGAWTLGVFMAGRMGGVVAVSAILTWPSAAHYWFENPYYNFHWLLQISTAGFAIGMSFLAVTLGVIAVRKNSAAAFWLSVVLSLLMSQFKMQFLPLLFASGLVLLAVFWRPRRWWMLWVCFALLLLIGGAGVIAAEHMPRAPHFLSMDWNPIERIRLLLPPGQIDVVPENVRVPFGIAILLLSAFGGLLPFYLLAICWRYYRSCGDRTDLIPLAFVGMYCLIVVAFPKNVSDEFSHRSFLLVYAILALWCGLFFLQILDAVFQRGSQLFLAMLCLVLLPFPLLQKENGQSGGAEWMKAASHNAVPRGLQLAADYIRKNSLASEITLKSSNDGRASIFGQLTALSERSAYVLLLENPSHWAWRLWGTPIDVVEAREAVSRRLLHADTFESFSRIAQAAGINWYVLTPPDRLPSDIESRAVKVAEGYFLLHFAPTQLSKKP